MLCAENMYRGDTRTYAKRVSLGETRALASRHPPKHTLILKARLMVCPRKHNERNVSLSFFLNSFSLLLHEFVLLGRFRLHLQRVQPFLVEFLLQQLVHFPLPFHLIQTFKHFRNDLDVKVRFRGRVAGWVPAVSGVLPRLVDDFENGWFQRVGDFFPHRIRERAADVHRGALRFRAPVPVRSDVSWCRFDFLTRVSCSRLMKVFRGGGRGKRSTRGEHLSQKCEDFTRDDDFNESSSIKTLLHVYHHHHRGIAPFLGVFLPTTTRVRRGETFPSFSQSRSPVPSLSFRQSLDVAVVFVETSIHFVYTLHKWSRQWSKSSACAKSHVCLHFIAACIAAWCNFKTSKYSSSVLISALFTR